MQDSLFIKICDKANDIEATRLVNHKYKDIIIEKRSLVGDNTDLLDKYEIQQ